MTKTLQCEVVPPRSKFKLVRSDESTPMWKDHLGRIFRIGYYSKQDGLECIWLVDEQGQYDQTTSREYLVKYFEPIEISDEADFYKNPKVPFTPLSE